MHSHSHDGQRGVGDSRGDNVDVDSFEKCEREYELFVRISSWKAEIWATIESLGSLGPVES